VKCPESHTKKPDSFRKERELMDKRIFSVGLFFLSLVFVARASGQFVPQEIAQREQWEEFLLSAEIAKAEPLKQGVTKPWKLYLKKGGIEKTAAWKNVDKRLAGGARDSWK